MELDKNKWNELLVKSNSGDSAAQNDLAVWYEEGYSGNDFQIEQDIKQAAHWYLESAKSGNKFSQDAISRLYSLGHGIEINIQQSIEWALKSIKQGNETAAYNLGTVYRDQLQFDKAFEYYSLALKMGDNSSLLQIGLCYYFGIGVTLDYQKAFELFEQVTKKTDVTEGEIDEANYWIGLSYLKGTGQIQSIEKARAYLHKVNIDNDHEPSQLILNLIGRNNDNKG